MLRLSALALCLLVPSIGAQSEEAAPSPATLEWFQPFDGKSLSGWTEKGGRYDGTARWSVEDGMIVGRSGPNRKGGLLYTTQAWHSFEFRFDTWIDYPFDSGVFVRMTPKAKGAQVTLDWRPGGEIGGIYSDGWLQHRSEGAEKFGKGAWNNCFVRCTGKDLNLVFDLNGERLTEFALPPGTKGYADTGLLGLQVHPGVESEDLAARFKNLELRELPVFDTREFTLLADGFLRPKQDSGWVDLLDAKLSRWEAHGGDAMGFEVEDGVLCLRTEGSASELRTRDDYGDFSLRMEFKTLRRANSGVFLRSSREGGNPSYTGCEIQVLDDHFWEKDTGSKLKPWQFTGSLYGAVAAGHEGALYPNGRWNTFEIDFVGSRIRTVLNGVTLYDVDTNELEPAQGKKFAERAKEGFLGLQRHAPAGGLKEDTYAFYKNVFVKRR